LFVGYNYLDQAVVVDVTDGRTAKCCHRNVFVHPEGLSGITADRCKITDGCDHIRGIPVIDQAVAVVIGYLPDQIRTIDMD